MSDSRFQVVRTDEAPPPLPQFSQAVVHNGMIYCSGNIGALPNTNFVLVQGTVKDRAVSYSAASNCDFDCPHNFAQTASWKNRRVQSSCQLVG